MENIGKGKDEIASVKKELQDFATKTIYSASEMATTYSQLAAVGIKNTDKLVMGFGGLAAAAENPTQAMTTLSQQATQMAAKPMVQWQDFKLMLEQTPAGIAAVAKTMGMSTSEMVTAVQDGKIATQDFFDAITKTGTNETFSKMATEYKTVGQAMDGLKETITNKLQPAFDQLSQVGIEAVSKLTDKIGDFNMDKISAAVDIATNVLNHFINGTDLSKKSIDALKGAIQGLLPIAAVLGSALVVSKAVPAIASLSSGFSAFSGILGGMISGPFKMFSSGLTGLIGLIPKIGSSLSMASSVGMGALGGMTSAMGTIMQVALSAIGPAAILGLVIAGLGLINNQFGAQIDQLLNTVTTKGPEIITNLVNGITSQLPQLMQSGTELIAKLASAISTMIPVIIDAGMKIIGSLVQGVGQNAPSLINSALEVITSFLSSIASALPELLKMGMELLLNIVKGIIQNIPKIVESVKKNLGFVC
ncbi:PblA-like tail protein [Enterococcus phage phiFL2A]|uniref:PblA-like tail protein n=1 Tax=Enterococcus phage phiFL2A TaxID=673835 RepID=D2IZH3_9CAUD|nr:tail protein [Enterococcus phage phiFL2A]ACZ63950.1 PblA-like tail protein [Enterococcus phage phiFL2A]